MPSPSNGVSEDELNAVKRIFAGLLLANKNLSLYPSGHAICNNSINQFYSLLIEFLQKYITLRLEIERDRVLFRSVTISDGVPEEGTLHFCLFRDGIRWIQFMNGIEKRELHDILIIINKYTKLSAEPDGDIVTSLWVKQFPHILYETAEFSLGDDQDAVDITGEFNAGKMSGTELREKNLEGPAPLSEPAIDQADLMLTPHEHSTLMDMIRAEEDADLASYLDALMDSLLQHREKENFHIILGVLSDEFTGSIARKDFIVTRKILEGLQYVLDICKADLPWAVKSIEEFSINASGPESLTPFKDVWKELDSRDAPELSKIFSLLNPKAIQTLVPLLSISQSAPIRQMLLDSIFFLASMDMRPLESMLNNPDEKLVERLIPLVINMEGEQSLKYLIKLTRHASGRVRNEAVKGILKRDPARVRDLFNMIDDKEESIRQLILKQMGQSRDQAGELFLLSYLQRPSLNNVDGNHVIECFMTLGRCGSACSVPFLSETLLRWRWFPGFGRSILRRGAALALVTLDVPEAEDALKRAGRSMSPGIRGIVKKVRQRL